MRSSSLIALAAAALAVGSCRRGGAPPSPVDPPTAKGKPAADPSEPGECAADEDCVLMPVLSCCGECPPAPPFEAVTRAELDSALIESEWHCTDKEHDCTGFACEALPEGCQARAACREGRCTVIESGCAPTVADIRH
jgi:hypothetical protein